MLSKTDFYSYVDGNSLLAPNPVAPGVLKGSDNGPMYTAEYLLILYKNSAILQSTAAALLVASISPCVVSGLLNRVPANQQDGQEGPDDYYGVLNACIQLGVTSLPRTFLKSVFKYFGALNNVNPGKWTAQSFLIRQPQLLCAMINAAFPRSNLVDCIVRLLAFPLYLISALIIALSCVHTDPTNTDARRLSWHLVQNLSRTSLLCCLASKIWYWRLYDDYGPTGMQAVAAIYYKPAGMDNPYAKYWVTK